MPEDPTPPSVFALKRFAGTISGEGLSQDVAFTAEVDARGDLNLGFDPLPMNAATFKLRQGLSRGQETPVWSLRGVGPGGETFSSDRFMIVGYHDEIRDDGGTTTLKGACSETEIVETFEKPAIPQFRWTFRRFRSFRGMQHAIEGGLLHAGGATPGPDDPQHLTGIIAVKADQSKVPASWWSDIEKRADHVRRVLSLASGVYLEPYTEDRLEGTTHRLRVFSRSNAPESFLPPFHFLNLEPIFQTACTSSHEICARFLELDPALRWLLSPGHYDEIRLLAPMTALENILEISYPSNRSQLMESSVFRKFAKAVRALIDEMGLPEAVRAKIAELNRPSFIEKVKRYVDEHGIVTIDFPNGGLEPVIKARNLIVHTGIYFNDEEDQIDMWDHMLVARELVIRILLDALKFEGNYSSALHRDAQLRFPSCRRLSDDQNIEIPIDDPAGQPRPPSWR